MSTGLPVSAPRAAVRAVLDGAVAVVLAVAAGTGMAYALARLGLTESTLWPLGGWLGGAGLLGGWRQEVTSNVAGGIEWVTYAWGVPLLVTGVVVVYTALRARHSPAWGAVPALAGAAAGGALLVAGSTATDTVSNSAGSVTTTESLTWVWDGQRPGAVTGAAVLVAVVWLLNTAGLRWWRSGRGVALSLLLGTGLTLTAAAAAGAVYLTSSTAVGIGLALLYPVLGSLLLVSVSGAPAQAGLTRLTPEPVDLSTFGEGLVYGIGGVALALALALIVGVVMRLFKHRSSWIGAVSVTAAVAAFLAWAMSSAVVLPGALGGESTLAVNPLLAAGIGAVLATVTRFAAGPPKSEGPAEAPGPTPYPSPTKTPDESDIEELLKEVGSGPP